MQLTGVNGYSYDYVYTDPYYATVNGVATTVICDDFATESSIGQTWQANVTNVASVVALTSTAKFSPAKDYDAVANLATQLVSVNPSSEEAVVLSYAIWDIFDPSGVSAWLSTYGDPEGISALASAAANAALAGSYSADEYSNVTIYTSTTGTPQEFVSVGAGPMATPEASTIEQLAFDLLAIGVIVLLFRRRTLHSAE
jgi:hypothetical protein